MRDVEERQFQTHDGVNLFFRYWPCAQADQAARAIVLFHRGHEHSARLEHIVNELDLPEFSMFAWDARGHGRSPGERGDSPGFAASVRDVDCFVHHVSREFDIPMQNIVVLAQSVGAVLVATWAHDYAPPVRCVVLASPAFKVKLYVPFARTLLGLAYRLRGNFFVNSYVKAKFLTHDPERIISYERDPLITRAISVRILLGLYDAGDRVVADAGAIELPVQLLTSDSDWVVDKTPQFGFFQRLGGRRNEHHVLAGFYHDTLAEKNRSIALEKIRTFVLRTFARPVARASLLEADRRGFTYEEEARLKRSLNAWSPKGLAYSVTRFLMRTVGARSDGVRLGIDTGFDSGSTLDYVYRNEAQGQGYFGRLIDRAYLDSVGWRGIRVRRTHLEQAIAGACERIADQGRPVRILDIAAGHGRYVLSAVAKLPARPESILLRDYSELNVQQGSALIDESGLTDIARFEQGDAFDESALAALEPKPTLAIVSGLYELFPDNELVSGSLRGLATAMDAGACLVYTGQPWHPQLEFIGRVLTSHRNNEPWIMRRRTQGELDELVAAAGFEKLTQWTDEWGIFTVSLAVRARSPA